MDYPKTKLPRPSISAIIIAVFLGAVAAIVIYLAQSIGLIPGLNFSLEKSPTPVVVSRPFLGISYSFVSQGAYIQNVIINSPADKAGLKVGDIIVKINGESINAENKVVEIISKLKAGVIIRLQVWRDGKEINLTARI